jgi:hypothetical protein
MLREYYTTKPQALLDEGGLSMLKYKRPLGVWWEF